MLLQIAFDKPEHLALMPQVREFADIIEIGTPVLKRFGISAISTARELCPDVMVLADTKTVDGGQLEADMVFGAGAAFMTVLSCASRATHETVGRRAAAFGATVIVDTITESGKPDLLEHGSDFPESFGYVAVHSPTTRISGATPITASSVSGPMPPASETRKPRSCICFTASICEVEVLPARRASVGEWTAT